MKNVLNQKLKQKLDESGLSVHALEKKAGLKRSAVQNILHGRSKKPSAEILFAISKVFGCSIRELLDKNSPSVRYEGSQPLLTENPAPQESLIAANPDKPLNIELYVKATKTAEKLFKKFSSSYNEAIALRYILEVYQYASNSHHDNIDSYFAEWLFKKTFEDTVNEKN